MTERTKNITLETSKMNDQNDQLVEITPEDKRKSELSGARNELKSKVSRNHTVSIASYSKIAII